MRAPLLILFVGIGGAGNVLADPGRPQTHYVKYLINMDFLPPLIGEKRCVDLKPCDIVKLDHFSLTLTIEGHEYGEDRGRLTIDCLNRSCALERGQGSASFRKNGRLVRFDVDDWEYSTNNLAVIRYRGNLIGEVLIAY